MTALPYDFAGGVQIPEHKAHRTEPPRVAPPATALTLSLRQYRSALRPTVLERTKVRRGDLLATGTAALHAPASGQVLRIDGDALVLAVAGDDRSAPALPALPIDADADAVLARIAACGVTGLGGGGFPSALKLRRARDLGVQVLIINAVETEPWVTADEALLRTRMAEIMAGIRIVARVLHANRTAIAVDPRNSALGLLTTALATATDIEVATVPARYPAGSERQLMQCVMGVPMPVGARPLNVGALVLSVATAHAICRAVVHGEPLTQRLLSITGPGVAHPGNIWTPIGYDIDTLLHWWQGVSDGPRRRGGPITGAVIEGTASVDKATYAVTVLGPAPRTDPCIRCGHCNDVCPEALPAQAMHFAVATSAWDAHTPSRLRACIECGACEVVCPSGLPLLRQFRSARAELATRDEVDGRARRARKRFDRQQARREAAAAEAEEARARRDALARPWLKQQT